MTVGADDNPHPDLEQYRSYLKLLADLQLNSSFEGERRRLRHRATDYAGSAS